MDGRTEPPHTRIPSRFIPLTRAQVITALAADPLGRGDADTFASVALRLQKHRAHVYRALGEEMRTAYLPFSPDADTLPDPGVTPEVRAAYERRLSALTQHLLDRANYQRLTNDEITAILSAQSPYSLRIAVDLAEYDDLQIYTRDTYRTTSTLRRPDLLWLVKETHEVIIWRRLFVLLKLKSAEARAAELAEAETISHKKALRQVRRRRRALPTDTTANAIYIKVFKDMPQYDLQILFPLRTVQFRPFDKLKFLATAGGGTAFGVFTTTGKILAASNPLAAGGALIGFVALVARQVSNFFNQRTRYMMELAQKLFFHNLASNRAALSLLLDLGEDEDVKEDLLTLYLFAGTEFGAEEVTARKAEIDRLVATRTGARIDFELSDALARLEADGIVSRAGGRIRIATLGEAADVYARHLEADDADDMRHIVGSAPAVQAA